MDAGSSQPQSVAFSREGVIYNFGVETGILGRRWRLPACVGGVFCIACLLFRHKVYIIPNSRVARLLREKVSFCPVNVSDFENEYVLEKRLHPIRNFNICKTHI